MESNVWRNFLVVFAELVADNRPEQAYETGSVSTRIESIGLARAPRTAGRHLAAKATVANRSDTPAGASTSEGVMPQRRFAISLASNKLRQSGIFQSLPTLLF